MPNLLDHKVRRTHGLSQKPPRHPGGAASLPAMSVPAVAVGDPEFFAIGEKMRPLIGPYFEAKKKSDAAYRQASNAVCDEDFRLADKEGRLTAATAWSSLAG